MKKINSIVVSLTLLVNISIADDSVDNVFSSGTAIKASKMNANFDKLSAKITELRGLISTSSNSHRKLVGVSGTFVNGGTGILNMNNQCNVSFPGSTMCTTDDILYSSTTIATNAWIHPIMAAYGPHTFPNGDRYYDTLGYSSDKDQSCKGWSSSASLYAGRTVPVAAQYCDTEQPIACCK